MHSRAAQSKRERQMALSGAQPKESSDWQSSAEATLTGRLPAAHSNVRRIALIGSRKTSCSLVERFQNSQSSMQLKREILIVLMTLSRGVPSLESSQHASVLLVQTMNAAINGTKSQQKPYTNLFSSQSFMKSCTRGIVARSCQKALAMRCYRS